MNLGFVLGNKGEDVLFREEPLMGAEKRGELAL